jgi:hypothetical protein
MDQHGQGSGMTNRFTTLAAAAALFACLPGLASAADVRFLGRVGPWKIAADDKMCHASLQYEDDGFLFFSVSSDGRATVGVGHPKWDIPDGTYKVNAWVDRGSPVQFKADASKSVVIWGWRLDAEQVGILSRGAVFHATIGRAEIHYRLDGSAAMLQALTRCAAERMVSANPFAGSRSDDAPSSNPFPETTSNPYRRM